MSPIAIHCVDKRSTNHALRVAHNKDSAFLYALFFERTAPRFALLGWNEIQLRSMMQMQYQARAEGYAQQFLGLKGFVICDAQRQSIGELLLHQADGEIRV